MAQDFSKAFYKSKEWRNFRQVILTERGPRCEKCGKIIANAYDKDTNQYKTKLIQLHHIEELTPLNINDASITLNPDNVQVLCQECHNVLHNRWQGGGVKRKVRKKEICIVYGPPCSGKKRYVRENMREGDLVIDMDRMYNAISLLPMYDKPNNLKKNVFAIRDTLISNLKVRYGDWNNAWIIGGYADKFNRERLASELGAELIFINEDIETCLYRLKYTNDYRQNNYDEWKVYIEKWFEDYIE